MNRNASATQAAAQIGRRLLLIALLAAAGCGEPTSTTNLSTNAQSNPELLEKAKADAAKAEESARKAEAKRLKQSLPIEDDANR